jgi:hypothetical protein
MNSKNTVAMAAVLAGLAATPARSAEPKDRDGSGPPPAAAPAVPAGNAQELAALTETYERLEQALKRLPRDQFDPEAVVEQVGRDPDALFQWVRDQTDLLPYRGALRGPVGVLMDRGGNSLDRALLLAQCLESAGYPVRLANAKLPDDQARELLARCRLRAHADAADEGTSEELQAARRRLSQLVEQLMNAIGQAAGDPASTQAVEAAALADHWWVQRQNGGRWVDLDLAATEPGTGQALLPAQRTLALPPGAGKLALPVAECQEVEFRAIIEAWRGDGLKTATVLHHVLRPGQVFERSLRFSHSAGKAAAATEGRADDPGARQKLKDALIRQEVYLPALWIDDRPITEASFTTTGAVEQNPQLDPAGKLAGGIGKTAGAFSALAGGDAEKDSGVLTAEWIEYEVRVPGEAPLTVRRQVFDLLGPAARAAGVRKAPALSEAQKLARALHLTGETRIFLQPCDLRVLFLQHRLARSSLKQKPIWLAMARGEINTPEKLARAVTKLSMPDMATPSLAAARAGINPGATQVFIDRPNIIHQRVWFEEDSTGEIMAYRGIDLAFTSTAALGAGAFRSRLVQGVADTLAEHLALAAGEPSGESTVTRLEAALAQGRKAVVVRPGDDTAALASLELTADGRARALADLAAGQILVLAGAAPGRWTWWRVDGRSGQTVGVLESGFNGSVSSERAVLEAELETMQSSLLRRVSSKELERMGKQEMWKVAQGNKEVFADLLTLQEDFLLNSARMIGRMGGF